MKIISTASECGYRKRLKFNQYPKWIVRAICSKLPKQKCGLPYPCVTVKRPFPIYCPLQDCLYLCSIKKKEQLKVADEEIIRTIINYERNN